MRKNFRVVGEPYLQSLKLDLPQPGNKVLVLRIPYLRDVSRDESPQELSDRALDMIHQVCPIGHILCEASVHLDKISGEIINPHMVCDLDLCPFKDSDEGGGSGDREPLNPVGPIDSVKAEVGM